MAKRIAFAHIHLVYDFDTLSQMREFKRECKNKGWKVVNSYENDDCWTVGVKRNYRNYNTGW